MIVGTTVMIWREKYDRCKFLSEFRYKVVGYIVVIFETGTRSNDSFEIPAMIFCLSCRL